MSEPDAHSHAHNHADGHHHGHASCAHAASGPLDDPKYRTILWIALAGNAAMFLVEIFAGVSAQSTSLLADAIDFFGDAANFAIALAVFGAAAVWRARAALLKGVAMLSYGVVIFVLALWRFLHGAQPEAMTMSIIGLLAFAVNMSVALMLYKYRTGDANMRSVWLCSRNDALANLAIIAAAAGVFGTGAAWPDLLVAMIMAGLGISSGAQVIAQARRELAHTA